MKSTMFLMMAILSNISMAKDAYVDSYMRKDGTYVQGHHRTAPNHNPYDNYSTRGNINPYTGDEGAIDPNRSLNSYSGYGQQRVCYQDEWGNRQCY